MKINSIQRAIFLSSCGLAVISSILVFSVALIVAYVAEDGLIDQLIKMESDNFYQKVIAGNDGYRPRFSFISLHYDDSTLPETIQAAVSDGLITGEVFTRSGQHYHINRINLPDGRLVTLVAEVSSLLVVTNMPAQILWLVFGAFLVFIGLGFILAYGMGMKSVKPLINLVDEVKSQGVNDKKVKFSRYPYEVGYLADVLEESFTQLYQALEREKDFTRDISHELRTPLTIFNNTLSLIQQRGAESSDFEELQSACKSMENTVQLLLALARQESLECHFFKLLPAIEAAILELVKSGLGENFQYSILIKNNVEVFANEKLFHRMLVNILSNAIAHSAGPDLKIKYKDNKILFQNTIPTDGNREKVRAASSGIQQGVDLIKRIADKMNWVIDIERAETLFTISLSDNQVS